MTHSEAEQQLAAAQEALQRLGEIEIGFPKPSILRDLEVHTAPLFSEAVLYRLLDRDDAELIIARYRQLEKALAPPITQGRMTSMKHETIYRLIDEERERQDRKWGFQAEHSSEKWYTILGERVGNVATALRDHRSIDMRSELIRVAALVVRWIKLLS